MNNFNLLRLCAALAVFFSHSQFLYSLRMPVPFAGHSLGSLGVYVFFFVSGYLVHQSWQREPRWDAFWLKRVARIFPGLVVASIFATGLLGPLMTVMPVSEYLAHPETWRYFINNAFGVATTQVLPGVFETTPFRRAVNGSLWTIRYELLMYLALSLLGVARLSTRAWTFPLLTLAMAVLWLALRDAAAPRSAADASWLAAMFNWPDVSALAVYFFTGCSFAALRLAGSYWLGGVALVAATLAVVLRHPALVQLCVWVLVPCGMFYLAYRGVRWIRGAPHQDISYGVYIYAFPIQQTMTQLSLDRGWPWLACLVLSLAATCALAWMSWHWVERPAMAASRRLLAKYRAAA